MRPALIRKDPWAAARRALDGLPGGGLNIAHEALERHAREPRAGQVALRWLLDQPGITAPIIGARTLEQLLDNLLSSGWTLSPEELAHLDQVSAPEEDYLQRFQRQARARR